MAQPWSVVEASPQYQALAPDAQASAKQQYFSQVVSQKPEYQTLAPADQQVAQAQFMGKSPISTSQNDPNTPPSVASEGLNFFKDHPVRAVFQGLSQTMTGKSFADRMQDAIQPDIPPATQKPFDSNIKAAQDAEGGIIQAKTAAGTLGGTVDAATTPGSYIPLPGAELLGKIPVGATTVGRIASNVAVEKTFPQGVKDLQAMESKLGNIDTSASGKAIDTSSRGVQPTAAISPATNQAILNAYNTIVQPSTGKFTSPSKLNNYNTKATLAMKTINDWSDTTGIDLTNKKAGVIPTATRSDLLDAVQATKKAIWDNIDSTAKNASMSGATVDMSKVGADVLAPLLSNPSIVRQRPDLLPFLNSTLKTYSDSGNISIDEAQNDLKILNDDIGKYMKSSSPNDASVGAVKLAISQNMRNQMDAAIEDHLGQTGYQDLRSQYGALSSVEGDITKAAARQAKGPTGLAHPMLDVMSGVDLGKALVNAITGNPVGAAKEAGFAGAMQGVKGAIDWMRSPDVKIAGMFNNINRNIGKTSPNISSSPYYNPAIKTLRNFPDSSNPQTVMINSKVQIPTTGMGQGKFIPAKELLNPPSARPEALVNNTNPNINNIPPAGLNASPKATIDQTNGMGTLDTALGRITPQPSIANRIVKPKSPIPRSEASSLQYNPLANKTAPKIIDPNLRATTNQTNSNMNVGPYQSVQPNAMDTLIKAHREVDLGNIKSQDVQSAIDMANHFNQNKISTTGMNIRKFLDINSLNKFVGNNESKVQLISTDSNGNFYAHLKGK